MDPEVNMEEEVISNPSESTTEDIKITEEVKGGTPTKQVGETKVQEQITYKLEDGSDVNVPNNQDAIDKFQKLYPTAKAIIAEETITTTEQPIAVTTELTKENKEALDKFINASVTPVALGEELKKQSEEDKNKRTVTPQAYQDMYDAMWQTSRKGTFPQYKSQELMRVGAPNEELTKQKEEESLLNTINYTERPEEWANAFGVAYAAKTGMNVETAKALAKMVIKDQQNLDNLESRYYQSTNPLVENVLNGKQVKITEGTPTKLSPIEQDYQDFKNGAKTFGEWNNRAKSLEQDLYTASLLKIKKGDYEGAIQSLTELESFQLNNAKRELDEKFLNGVLINKKRYAFARMSSAVAAMATAEYKLGNIEKAKQLEQIAKDNGAYSSYDKADKLQQDIAKAKKAGDTELVKKLTQDLKTEEEIQSLVSEGEGFEPGQQQPEMITGTMQGKKLVLNADGELEYSSTPTKESQYMGDIAEGLQYIPKHYLFEPSFHMIGSGWEKFSTNLEKFKYELASSSGPKFSTALNATGGLVLMLMGSAAAGTPHGALITPAFTASVDVDEKGEFKNPIAGKIVSTIYMSGSTYLTPILKEKYGWSGDTAETIGLITDILVAALLHGTASSLKGDVKTNIAKRRLYDALETVNLENPKETFQKILELVPEKRLNKFIGQAINRLKEKGIDNLQEHTVKNAETLIEVANQNAPKEVLKYTSEPQPTMLGELKNGDNVELANGEKATIKIDDNGLIKTVNAEGKETVLKTQEGETSLADAGIQQVVNEVSPEMVAAAKVGRPNVKIVEVNGKKYLVSLAEGAEGVIEANGKKGVKDTYGDIVLEITPEGKYINRFEGHPNPEFAAQRKLEIVNEARKQMNKEPQAELVAPETKPVSLEEGAVFDVFKQAEDLKRAEEGGKFFERRAAKRKIKELLAKNPKAKVLFDNMKTILGQIKDNENFTLKGDCL